MPEGDAVWRTARRLEEALTGQALTRTDFRVPRLATVDLRGATVVTTVPRGKHLLTRLLSAGDGQRHWTLHTHLRMEGTWRVLDLRARWPRPGHQARVVLETAHRQAVGFSLGVVELVPTAREDRVVGHLGPDVLGEDWDVAAAARRVARVPDRAVFEALLDQANLAGLGTIWAAELCHVAGVAPRARVGDVDLPRLLGPAPRLMDPHRRRPVLRVYGRGGRPCATCGRALVHRAQVGPPGRDRVAHWCPSCQPDG